MFLVVVCSPATAEPKKTDSPKNPKNIRASGYFYGKLTVLEGSTKNFNVQIEYAELDPGKVQALQNYIAQAKVDIARSTGTDRINKSASYRLEIQKRQLDLTRNVTKDIKLEPTEDMKVRWNFIPLIYDDDGKVKKKFSRKELKELKGSDKSLPGYAATFDNLRVNQIVKVYLAKEKKKKSKPKDADLFEKRLKAVMVVIMKDPTPAK
jgi:hypothetical protein